MGQHLNPATDTGEGDLLARMDLNLAEQACHLHGQRQRRSCRALRSAERSIRARSVGAFTEYAIRGLVTGPSAQPW